MRITKLATDPRVYSSNVFYCQGNLNRLEDRNVLIDTGGSGAILHELQKLNSGAGKKVVDYIILTHNHFDHTGGVKAVKDAYNCIVMAFNKEKMVDKELRDKDIVRIGDRHFQVFHTPGHSRDSICLYGWEDRILFCGDTPVDIQTPAGSYHEEFAQALKRLALLPVETIYPGHGPALSNGTQVLMRSLENVLEAMRQNH